MEIDSPISVSSEDLDGLINEHEELTGMDHSTLFSNEYDLKSAEANHSCLSIETFGYSSPLSRIVELFWLNLSFYYYFFFLIGWLSSNEDNFLEHKELKDFTKRTTLKIFFFLKRKMCLKFY